MIKEENLLLIQKCLEFYADAKNHEVLVPTEKGAFARDVLAIVAQVNKENDVAGESIENFDNISTENELNKFIKRVDDLKSNL